MGYVVFDLSEWCYGLYLLQRLGPAMLVFVSMLYLRGFTVCDLQRVLQRLGHAVWDLSSSTCLRDVTVCDNPVSALQRWLNGLRPTLTVCDNLYMLQRLGPAMLVFLSLPFLRGSLICGIRRQLQGCRPSRLVLLSSTGIHGVRVFDLQQWL